MIWSYVKIAIFVAAIAAATLLAGYFADTGGGIRIAFAHREFTLGPVQSVIGILLSLVALWLILKILSLATATIRFINGDETAISRYFDRNRERKGFQSLTEGMMALASGDGAAAISHATRAEKYLRKPELTNLLTAQAAEMAGDTLKATETYKKLLGDDRTRFVAIRGLLKQKMAEGDRETALKLAEKAFLMRPSHRETQDLLFDLQAEAGDWTGARKVLGAKVRHGHLPKDVHRRRDAVLALQQARMVFEGDAPVEAREAAIAANKASPDLIPAAVLAAHGYMAQGKPKHAVRILKKAWEAQPHPDLAAAFAALEPDETPGQRLKRFEQLFAARPDHEETRLLRAELLIAAEDFPAARRALGDLAESHPTTRALTIMAAIERGEGEDDAVVRGWLTRALSASRGPQWICDKCNEVNTVWQPTCEHCGSFDTLSWREARAGAAPLATDILPLVVRQGQMPEPAAAEPAGRAPEAPAPGLSGPDASSRDPAPAPAPEGPRTPRGAVYDAEFIDEAPAGKSAL